MVDRTIKTPCETIVWHILPVIRKEFAKNLVKNHGFTQKKIATRLGITEAAVSRYISGKRGNIKISNDKILKEIKESVNQIAKGGKKITIKEICRICNLMKSTGHLKGFYNNCK